MSETTSHATISEDGRYRYLLKRRWSDGPIATFIMLNPSTADAEQDDPTIRRCIGFAKREGCGALTVVNLMAFRATNPKELLGAIDPVGPDNRGYLVPAIRKGAPVIAAWGAHEAAIGRDAVVREIAEALGKPLVCLGKTKSGAPRHPLYVKAIAPLVAFTPA